MPEIFDTNPVELRFLLGSIHNKEIALPDFQRDFVWQPRATEELLESILHGHPAGSILRIRNSDSCFFAPRAVEGAPALESSDKPAYLVLDGQQRLTSLYQAIHGVGGHRYFMKMQSMLEGGDIEDSVFYLKESRAERRYGTIEKQTKKLVFPFSRLFNDDGFDGWLDAVIDMRPERQAELRAQLRQIRRDTLANMENYQFPVVTLSDKTKSDAICAIFETLNRTGVKLSVYDLLAAGLYPQGVRLRDMWLQARAETPILADFYDDDPYHIIQSVAIYTAEGAPSCKRGDVLQMKAERVQKGWLPVVNGIADMLKILREDCGVVISEYLPYKTMLIPAGAVLAEHGGGKGPDLASIRQKIKRWFWCAVFMQAYENAPNTQAVQDYRELNSWIQGGEEPEVVRDFEFNPDDLRQTTPRQRAVYYACLALILSMGALDFYSGRRVNAKFNDDGKVEDHHIFPKGYLHNAGNTDTKAQNCILNRTLIAAETNRKISAASPADYLAEIENAGETSRGAKSLEEILISHLLPGDANSALRSNRFDEFLAERQKLLGDKIKAVTSG